LTLLATGTLTARHPRRASLAAHLPRSGVGPAIRPCDDVSQRWFVSRWGAPQLPRRRVARQRPTTFALREGGPFLLGGRHSLSSCIERQAYPVSQWRGQARGVLTLRVLGARGIPDHWAAPAAHKGRASLRRPLAHRTAGRGRPLDLFSALDQARNPRRLCFGKPPTSRGTRGRRRPGSTSPLLAARRL
jgi:hypothetical protein